MDTIEDWSIEGDIGLGSKWLNVNENPSTCSLIRVSDMPFVDTEVPNFPVLPESSATEINWSWWLHHSANRTEGRRAAIRTLSGSWNNYESCDKSLRRRNSCGHVGSAIPTPEEQPSSNSDCRRHSSLLCCPDALRKLKRKIGSHLAKEDAQGESSSDDQQVNNYNNHEQSQQRVDESYLLLREANKTIAALQGKLDVYEGLLYGKSRASEVLLKQLLESVRVRAQSEARWTTKSREQQQEAGRLQFQLMSFQGNLTDTQRAWLERINGVLKENSDLQTTVQTQTRIIRKLSSDKTSLKRECEELGSLQDAKERAAYQRRESLRANPGDGKAAENALLELAILGSCCCRSKNQEPCPCAKSACRRQQQVVQLCQKVYELEEQKEETGRLMEIYRQSFEEQLNRNRTLAKKIALLERENELALKSRRLRTFLLRKDSESHVVSSLVDLVCDRTDALLQQQVLTKLLSRRLTELERGSTSNSPEKHFLF